MAQFMPRSTPAAGFPGQTWWVLAALAALAALTRFPLPIDETRYLTVAWEMWQRGDFLVPHLNGEAYSHKPPLLFWLFHAGWKVFGVNAWWPRLVPALAAALLLWVVRDMGQRLWPSHPRVAATAPLLLGGSAFFLAFSGFIMFDLLLAALVAVAARASWRMGESQNPWWHALVAGFWTGLAILAKGPVTLVFLVPLWLLGPWWRREPRARGWRWWGAVLLAFLVAAAVALAWALPAAAAGGDVYAQAILLKQTSQRMVQSFAHQRPFWYYGLFLPLLWLPWVLWPRAWQALATVAGVRDAAGRFLWAWLLLPLFILSLVSGKQPQYLLPLMAPLALLLCRGLVLQDPSTRHDRSGWFIGLLVIALGALLVAGSLGLGPQAPVDAPFRAWHRGWLAGTPWWPGALVALLGLAVPGALRRPWPRALAQVQLLTAGVVALVLYVMLHSAAGRTFDLAPLAQRVKVLQQQDRVVAFWGDYHGQLGFVGRLERPLPELMGPEATVALQRLGRTHPGAYVVVEGRGTPPDNAEIFAYRRKWWALVPIGVATQLLGPTGTGHGTGDAAGHMDAAPAEAEPEA